MDLDVTLGAVTDTDGATDITADQASVTLLANTAQVLLVAVSWIPRKHGQDKRGVHLLLRADEFEFLLSTGEPFAKGLHSLFLERHACDEGLEAHASGPGFGEIATKATHFTQ